MNYYLFSPIGVKSPLLTYESEQACERGEVCAIELRGKRIAGVVAGACEKPAFACKRAKILKNYLLPHQAHLARFIAQYYCVELGEAYSVFVPAEGDLAGDEGVESACENSARTESARAESVEGADSQKGVDLAWRVESTEEDSQKSGDYARGGDSAGRVRGESAGDFCLEDLCASKSDSATSCIGESRPKDSHTSKPRKSRSVSPHATKSRATKSCGAESRNIESKKLYTAPIAPPKALSPAQQEALEFLSSHTNPLLFGDTGSGKTEIYIHLIINALDKGKSALFLMPEIALTPQIESRLKAVFGEAVAIWHSKITPARKRKILEGLKQGSVRVVAGARSALFLPLRALGLIIVDEEHDDAYKSQSSPRYNARDLALYLGGEGLAQVVLGSATPSVVSYYHARKRGAVWRLRGRYFESQKNISIVGAGHCALPPLNSSLGKDSRNAKALLHCSARPSAPHSQEGAIAQSLAANTRIVGGEIQDSKAFSESTTSDSRTTSESPPHANLESKTDSEPTPAVGHSSTAIESSFSSKRCAEQALKASPLASGNLTNGLQGGRERACLQWQSHKPTLAHLSPSPLDEKEKENLKNNKILEVKAGDSKVIDSESERQIESARVGYSEKWDLESDRLESATDSESKKRKGGDSQIVDCHDVAPAESRNDSKTESLKVTDSEKRDCHADKPARNENRLDSKKIACHTELAPARNDKILESKSLAESTHALDSQALHSAPPDDDMSEAPIAPPILSAIARKLEKKEQIIIFLPTRAHYKMLLCRECGGGVECEFCSVNMSLHLDKNALICHYCHACKPIPRACPQCGAPSLSSHRIGTASVAEWLSQKLPHARIALFDRDAITTHKKLTTTLKAFNDGEIDILVGTQMLSKGHDYHNVNLAVILGIDYILKGSDYRANERAVSLLHQIAGRAGRRYDGEVCIESSNGAFLEAFLGDYEAFLDYELGARPRLYPPFVRLASITIAHKSEAKALEALQALRENLFAMEKGVVEVVGDSKALLERLQGKFRYILLLRSSSTRALLEVIHRIRASAGEFLRFYEIDVDPLSII